MLTAVLFVVALVAVAYFSFRLGLSMGEESGFENGIEAGRAERRR